MADKKKFNFSVPRKLYTSTGNPEVTITYYSRELEDGCSNTILPELVCFPKHQYSEELKIQSIFADIYDYITKNENYDGKFEIAPKPGYNVSLKVMWNTDVCPTYARKTIQE